MICHLTRGPWHEEILKPAPQNITQQLYQQELQKTGSVRVKTLPSVSNPNFSSNQKGRETFPDLCPDLEINPHPLCSQCLTTGNISQIRHNIQGCRAPSLVFAVHFVPDHRKRNVLVLLSQTSRKERVAPALPRKHRVPVRTRTDHFVLL